MNSDTKQQCHDQAMLHHLNGLQLAKDSLLLVQPSNHLLNGFLHNCLGKILSLKRIKENIARIAKAALHKLPAPRAENAKINVTDEPYFGT